MTNASRLAVPSVDDRRVSGRMRTRARTRLSRRRPTPAADAPVWPELRQPLVEAYFKAHPMFAVVAGRHEYDGLLPDWSAEGIATEIRRLHAAQDTAIAVPEASLDRPRDSSATISSRGSIAISSGSKRLRRRSQPGVLSRLDGR